MGELTIEVGQPWEELQGLGRERGLAQVKFENYQILWERCGAGRWTCTNLEVEVQAGDYLWESTGYREYLKS